MNFIVGDEVGLVKGLYYKKKKKERKKERKKIYLKFEFINL